MERKRDVIAVSGATGRQGGAVARHLLAAGARVRALARKLDGKAAQALAGKGAELVQVDLDDAASVGRALEGAWGVFAVQNTWEAGVEREEQQGKTFAEQARRLGVQHFVYSSVGSANRKTGIPHFESKWRVEEAVRGLRFPSYVILRPTAFMENILGAGTGLAEGKLRSAIAPETRVQTVAVDDIGRFGVLAFTRHAELDRREIELAGDELTVPEEAEILTGVLRTPIRYERQPIQELRAISEDLALNVEWFDRVGYDADIDALERTYGIKMTRFRDWAAANKLLLSGLTAA
jgi:uncharacterized protein YbjT (DUF2867 family)